MGNADRVHVASQVQVEVVHRHDLREATTSRAALDAEGRPQTGLSNADSSTFTNVTETLAQTNGSHRLALAKGRRRNAGDVDVFARRPGGRLLE